MELTLMTWNVGIKQKIDGNTEDLKREYIKGRKITAPGVIFLQEAKADDDVDAVLKGVKAERSDYTIFPEEQAEGDAVIMIRDTLGTIEHIPITIKGIDDIQKRLMVCKVTLNKTSETCYFASWHGRWHNTGVSNDEKAKRVKSVITAIKRKSSGTPFIIGGDFNLEADKILGIAGIVKKWNAEHNKFDYFVLGNIPSSWYIGECKKVNIQDNVHLDHFPKKLVLQIPSNSEIAKLAESVSGMQVNKKH